MADTRQFAFFASRQVVNPLPFAFFVSRRMMQPGAISAPITRTVDLRSKAGVDLMSEWLQSRKREDWT